MVDRVEMSVEDAVLAILHSRVWGMTYNQIVDDPAWLVIKDGNRSEMDYPYGIPTTRTLDATIIRLLNAEQIERIDSAPPAFRVRRKHRPRAESLAVVLSSFLD
jgi:hypothetical protein